jgi:hypothetical protein
VVFILLLELNGPDPAQGERLRIEVAENVVTLTDLPAVAVAVTGFRGTYDCGSAGKPTSVVEDFVILGMGTAAST